MENIKMIKTIDMSRPIKTTVLLILFGQALDVLTTAIGLSIGGVELNPLVYQIGWGWVITIKILVTIASMFAVQYVFSKKWMEWAIVIASCMMVPWNLLNLAFLIIG